jgi:hypothetical protein
MESTVNPSAGISKNSENRNRIVLLVGGLVLVACCIWLTALSPRLGANQPKNQVAIIGAVGLMALAGGVYLLVVLISRRADFSKVMGCWVLGTGLVMRLAMFPSTPILEDDHFRYLWDGAVASRGINPYRYAPLDAITAHAKTPHELKRLALSSGNVIHRINYPWLRTVYPPVAQAAFATAHWLAPWSLTAWRLLLAAFDLATLWLVWRLGLPFAAVVVYWLNPLLVKEIYNSAHLDMLLLPFLVSAATAIYRERWIVATVALVIAAGIKLWPALLLPIVWRRLSAKSGNLVVSLALTALLATIFAAPMLWAGFDRSAGLVAYGRHWEMNNALYLVIKWIGTEGGEIFTDGAGMEALAPRAIFALLVVGTSLWASANRHADVAARFLLVVAVLFLLSPTQFPWYYIWMLPFLAWRPNMALILYTALLPLYYLRPALEHVGRARLFDEVLVWVEHGPVICLLSYQWARGRIRPSQGRSNQPARSAD